MWNKVWITKRRTKKGTSYDLRWYDSRRLQQSEFAGTDRRAAESLRKKREWQLNHGLLSDFDEIAYERFKKEHLQLRQGTVAAATIRIEQRVLDLVGDICRPRMLSDLTALSIERFKAQHLKTVSRQQKWHRLRDLVRREIQAVSWG